jgi:hypothetical protein
VREKQARSLRWKVMAESTVRWFIVKEKLWSGWKNRLKSTDYKKNEHGLTELHCCLAVTTVLRFRCSANNKRAAASSEFQCKWLIVSTIEHADEHGSCRMEHTNTGRDMPRIINWTNFFQMASVREATVRLVAHPAFQLFASKSLKRPWWSRGYLRAWNFRQQL